MTPQNRHRFRFREAYRAWKRLWANPDDTEAVFEIIDALRGRSEERVLRRFRATPMGTRILNEKRNLLGVLCDRAALSKLQSDSLGRAYLAFVEKEQISADGLVEASAARDKGLERPEDLERFVCRWRDMHDLHHVLTGYGRDLHGEVAVLAFSFAQTKTLNIGFIVMMAYLNGDSEDRRLIRQGFRRGRQARWLVAADWEALLTRPLAEVRKDFSLNEPEPYVPLWSSGAPTAAA